MKKIFLVVCAVVFLGLGLSLGAFFGPGASQASSTEMTTATLIVRVTGNNSVLVKVKPGVGGGLFCRDNGSNSYTIYFVNRQ